MIIEILFLKYSICFPKLLHNVSTVENIDQQNNGEENEFFLLFLQHFHFEILQ